MRWPCWPWRTGHPSHALGSRHRSFAGYETPWWLALIGLILISTVFSYTTGVMAARALGSKVASFISLTEVLFAVLWAWLLLSELPGPVQLLGGLLIVGGVVLVRVDELVSGPDPQIAEAALSGYCARVANCCAHDDNGKPADLYRLG